MPEHHFPLRDFLDLVTLAAMPGALLEALMARLEVRE